MAKKRLTWYRWEWFDPIQPQFWTACTVSVYSPTLERPYVSLLLSMANGGGRVLMRVASLAEARRRIGIPDEAIERLEVAVTKATEELEAIRRDFKLLYGAKNLEPGSQVVRTDTGEVIAEAERILKEKE